MATASENLQATLSEPEYRALSVLAASTEPLSGRRVAEALGVSPTTANKALLTLSNAGYASSSVAGRATLWRLIVSNPAISEWLEEETSMSEPGTSGSNPYSTGGGGTRLEHTYAACLIAAFLAGEPLQELGDALPVDVIHLQASDLSDVDDLLLVGRDARGETHRSSIAVRRSPELTRSDSASVPLFRDFLLVVTQHWPEASLGSWRVVLAVSTNANAVTQLAELAELAHALPSASALDGRFSQVGRTNDPNRKRYEHIKALVEQAAEGLDSAQGLDDAELTWRVLHCLSVRNLRLERTDRADRTNAVAALQRALHGGTPATADALFSRLEELVGVWEPQGAVLTQALVRRSLSDFPLSGSARFGAAWEAFDRLRARLRDTISPRLRSGEESLELDRPTEKPPLIEAMRAAGSSRNALVVTGEPDVGKSALALRAAEAIEAEGSAVLCLSLRDLPRDIADLDRRLGGADIGEALGAAEVRPVRLLLIDGAESVLEGKDQLFRTVATAALRADLGVVAVTRGDGSAQVKRELERALELSGSDGSLKEHTVDPLTPEERRVLPTTFGALARLAGDDRASWLLGRPGLVDVLLKSGSTPDPDDLLCEADVFAAVWNDLVLRNGSRPPDAAPPDEREWAALCVARRLLGLPAERARGTSTAELRSDGVLREPADPAFASGDEFATDLLRDFAVCRLFIVDGWDALASAGAPRWTIRAARLACQRALGVPDSSTAWVGLTTAFSGLSDSFGARWSELPYEALLTLGNAEPTLRDLWPHLTNEDSAGLLTLFRLAEARYVSGTIGDTYALAPLVRVAFCEERSVEGSGWLGSRNLRQLLQALVLAWLRGMAVRESGTDELRASVRDAIIDSQPRLHDDFAVEALATLGSDLDDRAEAWLTQVATDRPGRLHDAVESPAVAVSMSQAKPQLLLALTEAYYIELPNPRNPWHGSSLLDDGIRDFAHGVGPGLAVPRAAWYYGPFFRLLHAGPADAISLINRMLDHAAQYRVRRLSSYGARGGDEELQGLRLNILGTEKRHYVGDSHVWAWYRGTSVGPLACMSALLAVERFADTLLERVNVPARTVIGLLLRDCHNLAMVGLVVGLLERHRDAAGQLLDPFLASPGAWSIEMARVTGEHGIRLRDPGADELTGSERRKFTFHDVVGEMVFRARLAGDDGRLSELHEVGNQLLAAARSEAEAAGIDDPDHLATVESWSEELRIENYRVTREGDQLLVQFERPERIEQVLAPRTAELQTANVLYGFQNRYATLNDDPRRWPTETLVADLQTAREIDEADKLPEGMLWPENALVAVAAAAVRAHALGLAEIDEADLRWAIDGVLWAAENPATDPTDYSGSMFPMGADRAAAAAAPLLLLAPFDALRLDANRIDQCLKLLGASHYDEVRAIYALGCHPVWQTPCEVDPKSGACRRHHSAWLAAIAALADCRLGPWDVEGQRRERDPLPKPFRQTLPGVADDALLVNQLRAPLACLVDARQVACLAEAVGELWEPLWDAHGRSLFHWWKEGYDHQSHIVHEPIARRMIEVARERDPDPVRAHIERFAADANALHLLFDGFATVLTYEPTSAHALEEFWPWALEIALDAVGDGSALRRELHWFDYMVAALLPTPNPRSSDSNIDATLARCRASWIQPRSLGALAERWLRLARHEPKAVDAVIKLAKCAPLEWQSTTALSWIEQIINDRWDLMANHLWFLGEWLTDLRDRGALTGETERRYHRLIDGLAAAGDHAAVRLQQLDE